METIPDSILEYMSTVDSLSGPFRFRVEQTATPLRQLVSTAKVLEGRCVQPVLGRPRRILFPAVQSDPVLPVQANERSSGHSFGHPVLAGSTMVPNADGYDNRHPSPGRDLLTSPMGESHPLVLSDSFRLVAWKVSGSAFLRKEFQMKLRRSSSLRLEKIHKLHTSQPGSLGEIGVLRGIKIPCRLATPI